MAAPSETGPRRAQRAILLEPLMDSQQSLTEARFRRAASSAATRLTIATSSWNLFSRPVILDDEEANRRGRMKTWIFLPLLGVTAIIILAFYATAPTLVTGTLNEPDVATLLEYTQYAPSCPCSTGAQTVQSAATLNIPPALNFSSNVCHSILQVVGSCGGADVGARAWFNCTGTLQGALLYSVSNYLGYVAYEYWQGMTAATSDTYGTSLGSLLLMPQDLNATIQLVTLQQMQEFNAVLTAAFAPVHFGFRANIVTEVDQSVGSLAQSPPGCSCQGSFMSLDPVAQLNNPCYFTPAYDTRPGIAPWSTCNIGENTLLFPLILFSLPETYEMLSIPPDVALAWMNFTGIASFTNATRAMDFFHNISFTLFEENEFGQPDTNRLKNGFVDVDFAAHFASCNPQVCTYSYRGRPSFVAALTTALGVISGLQTLLTLLVDKGYDTVVKQPPVDKQAGGDVEEADAGAAVEMRSGASAIVATAASATH